MEGIVIIYWTATGITEEMAKTITEGVSHVTENYRLIPFSEATVEDVKNASKVMLGCPACYVETIDTIEFKPFYESVKPYLDNKDVALFGAFGWGGGRYMRDWENDLRTTTKARLFESGLDMLEGINGDYDIPFTFGKRFANL